MEKCPLVARVILPVPPRGLQSVNWFIFVIAETVSDPPEIRPAARTQVFLGIKIHYLEVKFNLPTS